MVVGAGLAGLSAACHLAGSGHEVVVVERETIPGGRAGRIVRDGYTFDTGPTVMTMPGLLADVVGAAGSRLEDLLPMVRLDPAYRAAFADGSEIRVRAGHEAMREEIREACGPADAAAFDDFVDWLRDLYELEMPHFIDRNFDSRSTSSRHRELLRGCCGWVASGGWAPLSRNGSRTSDCDDSSASRRCMRVCRRAGRWPSTR